MDCNHSEGIHHDCEYVNERNSYLAEAERLASLETAHLFRGNPGEIEWLRLAFGVSFLKNMQALMTEKIRPNPIILNLGRRLIGAKA